jgi:predicted GIY-YIG superfamily endonuclease
METYTVYIICNPQKIYYKGFTSDVLRRLEEHNSSIGKYTSEKGPWTLVFKHQIFSKTFKKCSKKTFFAKKNVFLSEKSTFLAFLRNGKIEI